MDNYIGAPGRRNAEFRKAIMTARRTVSTRDIFRYDPDVGYAFIPNLQLRVPHDNGGYLIRTNAQGFRSERDFSSSLPGKGKKRILLFGDSFTVGEGVSNKFRYSDRLETMIDGVEVFNYGFPGTGTDQQLIINEKFAQDVPADLVIIAVLVENIRRVLAHFRPFHDRQGRIWMKPKPYFTIGEKGQLKRHHQPVPNTVSQDELLLKDTNARTDSGGKYPLIRKIIGALGFKEKVQNLLRY